GPARDGLVRLRPLPLLTGGAVAPAAAPQFFSSPGTGRGPIGPHAALRVAVASEPAAPYRAAPHESPRCPTPPRREPRITPAPHAHVLDAGARRVPRGRSLARYQGRTHRLRRPHRRPPGGHPEPPRDGGRRRAVRKHRGGLARLSDGQRGLLLRRRVAGVRFGRAL